MLAAACLAALLVAPPQTPVAPDAPAIASAADAAAAAAPATRYPLGEHHALKVLYAGVDGTPRHAAFATFLATHFDHFRAIDTTQLDAAAAAPFDVVVIDGKRLYPMDPDNPSIDQAKCQLGAGWGKPTVMIGAMGGHVQRHTKLDWL